VFEGGSLFLKNINTHLQGYKVHNPEDHCFNCSVSVQCKKISRVMNSKDFEIDCNAVFETTVLAINCTARRNPRNILVREVGNVSEIRTVHQEFRCRALPQNLLSDLSDY
jgi:hypothetical protein